MTDVDRDPDAATSFRPSGLRSRLASRSWRVVMLLAGVAVMWTLLVGVWLPQWARPRVEAAASQFLGEPVAIDRLRVQPWTGLLSVQDLRVGSAASPLLTLHQADLQLSLESIWRLAPVLRRVTLTRPALWIERQSAQRFNFSPIVDKLVAKGPSQDTDEAPPRFAVFNITVQDGSVRYSDRVLSQTHRIEQLQIGVPFISSLASQIDVDVKPMLSARLDGSPLRLKGRVLPFNEDRASELDIRLDAVDVPHWLAAAAPLLPPSWRPQARSGRMDVALTVGFAMRPPPALPLLSIRGRLQLDQLGLSMRRSPLLGDAELNWDSLKIEGIDAAPLARQLAVGKIDLDGLRWRSQLKWGPAASVKADSNGPTRAVGTAQDWAWRVDQVHIKTGRMDVQPATAAGQPTWPVFEQAHATIKNLNSARAAAPASWELALRDAHQASLQAQGKVQVANQAVQAQLELNQLQLAPWMAPLQASLKLPVVFTQGAMSLQANVNARFKPLSASEPAQASLVSARLQLQDVRARAAARAANDRLHLPGLTLEGVQAQLDLGKAPALRQLRLTRLHLDRLDVALTRGLQGEWLGMAAASPSGPRPTPDRLKPSVMPDIRLASLACEACQLRLVDQTVQPAARLDVARAHLRLTDLSSVLSDTVGIELDTLAQGRGQLRFKGEIKLEPLSVNGRLHVAGLDLRAVQPYIDPLVNIRLARARAQADGRLTLLDKGDGAGLRAQYKGRAGLQDVRVQDRVNEADILRWHTLSLDGLDLRWADQALDAQLGMVSLKDFYGRLIINPDGQLNLAGVMRQEAGAQVRSLSTPQDAGSATAPVAGAASLVAASAPTAAVADAVSVSRQLRWQQIQVAKGRIDFTDNFIKPNYSARLTQIEGEVSAVSSSRPEPATIRLSGTVDDGAPLRLTGQLHPLGPRLYTDIQGTAKGIELTRLTPYAARYAGYAIEKGTLSVTVHYKVDGGKLEARNQIFLDQLTFGDKADSPDALNLPVRLAVSLLQNSRGEIDVNLPVSGSLDDPEFSVGGIIWRVLANLIGKAVTAPFALLSGGGSDELGAVPFEPGSARLGEVATQRLDALASKLHDRPALKLEATGRADPAVDEEGLRLAHVNRLMRAAKAKAMGLRAPEVRIGDEERPTWLREAYQAADIKKPRNVIGLAKSLSGPEMEALLKASAQVDEQALRTLANRRGDAVKAYLADKLPSERVLLTASKIGTQGLPQDKEPTTRVQFSVK